LKQCVSIIHNTASPRHASSHERRDELTVPGIGEEGFKLDFAYPQIVGSDIHVVKARDGTAGLQPAPENQAPWEKPSHRGGLKTRGPNTHSLRIMDIRLLAFPDR
jgi:hypothetical protein